MQAFDFISPTTLPEALAALGDGARPAAGCTDLLPQLQRGGSPGGCLVDISHLSELRGIRLEDGDVIIGALTTYAELIASPILQSAAPALVQAAQGVGCVQTRQRGTLGGNIATASPAGDALPPLLVLEAVVHIASRRGQRAESLEDLLAGPRRTSLAADELITQVRFRRPALGTRAVFLKLGGRQGMAVAVASVAVLLMFKPSGATGPLGVHIDAPGGFVHRAHIALGAVAPTPMRALAAEALLEGAPIRDALSPERIEHAAAVAAAACAPIDDVRAPAAYRRRAIRTLTRRALERLKA